MMTMNNMEIKLSKLGLTNNEAKVYIALLNIGQTNAGTIISKTKLHRNIVYFNLERLMEKGLVSYVIIKNIKHFETTKPLELKNYIQRQKDELLNKERLANQILPEIEKVRKTFTKKQDAVIFQGKKGVRNVLEMMTNTKELLLLATGWGARKTFGTYFDQWHFKLKQNKVKSRAILSQKSEKEKYPYKVKYLKGYLIQNTTTAIFEDKVVNIIWQEDPIAVMITSKQNADSYRNYFEMLWKNKKN